jgi:hypothetical protein
MKDSAATGRRETYMITKAEMFLALSFLVVTCATTASAQKTHDQIDAPVQLTASARIAPVGEPGTPLVISGTLVGEDGKTPLAGAIISSTGSSSAASSDS